MFCGELSYKPKEFWNLTPREANNVLNGYNRKQENQLKQEAVFSKSLQETIILTSWLSKKDRKEMLKNLNEKFSFLDNKDKPKLKDRKPKTKEEHQAYWDAIDKKRSQKK